MRVETLTAKRLRQLLRYDPETGVFRWRVARGCRKAGSKAGTTKVGRDQGYLEIRINQCDYRAARLAWLYMTGEWPPHTVDHRDTDRGNNRWRNLRLATSSQNNCNQRTRRDNTSGFKGVSYARNEGKYQARIWHNGRQHSLGYFKYAVQGAWAYRRAALKLHGEFARM
jgi:hypothetical protein